MDRAYQHHTLLLVGAVSPRNLAEFLEGRHKVAVQKEKWTIAATDKTPELRLYLLANDLKWKKAWLLLPCKAALQKIAPSAAIISRQAKHADKIIRLLQSLHLEHNNLLTLTIVE